jgi:hypothetical protein
MDFSQPKKINSYPPKSIQKPHQPENLSSNSFLSYSTPYQYQQHAQNALTGCHLSQNHYIHPQFSGGDLNTSLYSQDSNFYQPQQFTNLALHEPLLTQRGDILRQTKFDHSNIVDDESSKLKSAGFYFRSDDFSDDECADPNAKIQHFHQNLSSAVDENQQIFNPIQTTFLSKYNQGNQQITRILPQNQQTLLLSQTNDMMKTDKDERIFRSHTHIQNIPNGGFKIITEIYRDDDEQPKVLESVKDSNSDEFINSQKSNESVKLDENWIGKSIETTVDVNSCEILTDDADESSENL